LTVDNHNSVNGIREFARAKGAAVDYAPLTLPDLRIDMAAGPYAARAGRPARANLFAFPAQSNFSGVKHPLSLIDEAHEHGWHVLVDAAAFVPTNRLDLRLIAPDFVAISFYKMFGYPHRRRLPPDPQQRARHAAAAMVCRRHRELRNGAGARPRARTA